MTVHPVEKLWREHDLPEWFLGNGESNTKLYALYDAIFAAGAAQSSEQSAEARVAKAMEALNVFLSVLRGSSSYVKDAYELHVTKDAYSKARGIYDDLLHNRPVE